MKFAAKKKASPLSIEMTDHPTTYETTGRQLYALIESSEPYAWRFYQNGKTHRVELVNIIHRTGEIRWYVETWRIAHNDYDAEAIKHFGLKKGE